MAAGDRESTLTIKAADLSSQPINVVREAIEKLIAQQQKLVESAKSGTASQADFGKSLADLGKAAGAVTAQISAIESYNGALEQLATRLNKVGDAEARRAVLAEKAETGAASKKELTELKRLEGDAAGSITRLQEGVDKFRTKTVDPLKAQLERMGVTFDTMADSLNMLRSAFEAATKQQIIGNEVDREFIELKNQAKAATTALAAEQQRAAQADAAAQSAFMARRQEEKKAEQERLSAAEKSMAAAARAKPGPDRGADMLAALQAQDEANKRAADLEKVTQAAFVARRQEEKRAEQERRAAAEQSMAAAARAKPGQDRGADMLAALHEQEQAERHIAAAETAAYEERAAREKQIIGMAEAERTAVLNTINERLTREKALDDARAAAYAQNMQREQALAEQRRKASEATASIPGRMPLGESATPVPGFSSVAQSVSGIVSPAQAARETLKGLEAEITGLADRLTQGRRKVEDYRADLRTLGLAFEALRKQASLVDLYRSQEEATRRAETTMRQEVATLEQLRERIKNATVAEEGFDAKLRAAQKSARDATVAFNEQNEALAKTRASLDAAGISYLNIDNTITRLKHSAAEGKRVFDDLNPKTGGGAGGEFRFLGLRPYELQNLSYQINDVFTQLASGTSISQTLAQQGGQIFQLFQKQIVNAYTSLKEIPYALSGITVGLALATVGIFAFIRALDEAANRRAALAQIALSVDGATVSVEALMAAARGAEKLGADFSEAAKGARELSNAGQGKRLEALLVVAAQLSRAFGKPFAEALKEVQAAFSGGYDAMSKFATEYDLLREREDKHIRQLYDEGQAEKARAAALELIVPRFEDAYKKGISPFSDALQKTKNDWTGFLRAIADSSAWDFLERRLASLVKTLTLGDIPTFFNTINDILHGRADPLTGLPTPGARQPAAAPGGAQPAGIIPNTGPFAGGTQGSGNERNVRNNNPVNLNFVGQQGATLETGVEKPRFAKFENMETGVSAALGQALLDQSRGLKTIEQLITKYTPPGKDGNPVEVVEKYIKEVSEALGVKRNEPVDLSERDKAVKYIIALAKHEGGVPDQGQVERGVDFRLQGGQPAANKQALADRAFQEERTKRLREQERETMTEEQRRQDLAQREIESDRQIAAEAAKVAEEKKVGEISATKVAEAQAEARKALRDRENKDRLARELEVTSELNELRDRALNGDKTNLTSRLQLVADFYDKQDKRIQEFQAKGRFPTAGGITFDQAQALSKQGRQAEQDRVALDTAKEVVSKAVQERDEALKLVREQLAVAKPADIPALLQKQSEIFRQSAPKIQDAIAKSDQALNIISRGPGGETQDVQAQRARNRLLEQQTTGTAESRATTQQGISLASQSVQSVAKERQDQIDAVISQVRSGSIKFDEALRTGLKLVHDTAPRLNQAIDEANRVLTAARDVPGVTDSQKAEINKIIAHNNLERQKQNEDVERVITEGLKDDQERLTRVLDENKKEQEHLFRQAESGQISYVKMVEQLAALSRRNAPRIQAARDAVVSDTRTALQTPNLREGFRSELKDRQTSAETGGDTALAEAEQRKKTIADGLKELDELRSSIRDVEREQQALQKQGLASVESSEAARRSAYAKTNEAAKEILPTLKAQIDLAEKLGQITPAAAQKARAAMAEFGAETKYASEFTKQLGKTIESSIENRASQAFDTIAQSLGNLIAGFGTLKDVWSAVGTAFAQFAAGVLKDLATMIIKAYLYAEISALLGIPTGSGTVLSSISGAISPTSKHSGGMVGDSNGVTRVVDLSVFRDARRMHNGGLLGLNADEVPTILQRGEEVLSKTDARNRANGGGNSTSGGGGTAVRNVLAVGDKEIAGAMNGAHGEKVILSVLQRNAPTVRKWVG